MICHLRHLREVTNNTKWTQKVDIYIYIILKEEVMNLRRVIGGVVWVEMM